MTVMAQEARTLTARIFSLIFFWGEGGGDWGERNCLLFLPWWGGWRGLRVSCVSGFFLSLLSWCRESLNERKKKNGRRGKRASEGGPEGKHTCRLKSNKIKSQPSPWARAPLIFFFVSSSSPILKKKNLLFIARNSSLVASVQNTRLPAWYVLFFSPPPPPPTWWNNRATKPLVCVCVPCFFFSHTRSREIYIYI